MIGLWPVIANRTQLPFVVMNKLIASTMTLVSIPDVLSFSMFGHILDWSQLKIFSWTIWMRLDAKFVARKYASHKGICLI